MDPTLEKRLVWVVAITGLVGLFVAVGSSREEHHEHSDALGAKREDKRHLRPAYDRWADNKLRKRILDDLDQIESADLSGLNRQARITLRAYRHGAENIGLWEHHSKHGDLRFGEHSYLRHKTHSAGLNDWEEHSSQPLLGKTRLGVSRHTLIFRGAIENIILLLLYQDMDDQSSDTAEWDSMIEPIFDRIRDAEAHDEQLRILAEKANQPEPPEPKITSGGTVKLRTEYFYRDEGSRLRLSEGTSLTVVSTDDPETLVVDYNPNPYRTRRLVIPRSAVRPSESP